MRAAKRTAADCGGAVLILVLVALVGWAEGLWSQLGNFLVHPNGCATVSGDDDAGRQAHAPPLPQAFVAAASAGAGTLWLDGSPLASSKVGFGVIGLRGNLGFEVRVEASKRGIFVLVSRERVRALCCICPNLRINTYVA